MTAEKPKEDNQELAKIEKRLAEIDPNIFQGIPKPKKQQIIRSFAVTMSKTHIGPLPDPETLAEYSEIIPNGAERIMQMAEKQLSHRMNMENKVIGGQLTQSNIGQFLAFFVGLSALGCATYAIVNGYEWSGSALGLGGLTGLVTAFIKGRDYQNKNLEKSVLIKNPNFLSLLLLNTPQRVYIGTKITLVFWVFDKKASIARRVMFEKPECIFRSSLF